MLFDNGWYSVIAGEYEGKYAIGERWNGDEDRPGFPNQGKYPTWHVDARLSARRSPRWTS